MQSAGEGCLALWAAEEVREEQYTSRLQGGGKFGVDWWVGWRESEWEGGREGG